MFLLEWVTTCKIPKYPDFKIETNYESNIFWGAFLRVKKAFSKILLKKKHPA